MSERTPYSGIRVGIHIHVYLILTLLLASAALLFLGVALAFDGDNVWETLLVALALVAAFFAALYISARRCGSRDLGYWEGLRLVAAYMSLGVGGFSMLFAIPTVLAATLASIGITLFGLVRNDSAYSTRNFRRLVAFFCRHRLVQ